MQTISIINQKGGVGKSTTAHALGAKLHRDGNKVLFIDLDPQCNITFTLQAEQRANGGSLAVLLDPLKIKDEIQATTDGDILASTPTLAGTDILLASARDRGNRLKTALNIVSNQYDYCIIDTPPALGTLTINALNASHSIIIPAQADPYSIQGLYQLHDTIQAVKSHSNPNLKVDGVVITRYNNRTNARREVAEALEQIANKLDTKVYKTRIRECIAIVEAQLNLQNIFDYAPKSNAVTDYTALINEITK